MMRGGWIRILSAALATWCAAAGVAHAAPRRMVWRGTERFEDAFHNGGRISPVFGTPVDYFHLIVVNFTYIEEVDDNGRSRSVSRRVTWTAKGKSVTPGYETVTCDGAGGGELLGASDAATREMLRIPCTVSRESNFFAFFLRPPTSIKPPDLVPIDKLRDNCSYSEETPGRRYSVWLSGEFDAVMEVDARPGTPYAAFTPAPGRALVFSVHTVPAMPALFRFVLDKSDVSRFPGYTSNAAISDEILENAGLGHLKGKYANDDPDWIFDEKDFENRDKWTVVQQDVVETGIEDTTAAVTVTAMDYGAIGKLRAYVKVKCGGWQPVRIRFNGQDRDAVSIPMDEDNNLIADSMQEYIGDPGADVDAEPAGKGFAGDGLTTFEEYRGFATAGGSCASPADDVVVRTDPRRKDLFIHAPDPEMAAAVPHFEWASGVTVHLICERHFVDVRQRVVNFTLQTAELRQWHGKTISGKTPQHGLFLSNEWVEGHFGTGTACVNPPKCDATDTGPPKFTAVIMIDKARTKEGGGILGLINSITHETGHAVGLPHHADTVVNWKIVGGPTNIYAEFLPIKQMIVEPGEGCSDPRTPGGPGADVPTYNGDKFMGCGTTGIKVRSAQNSGDAECPMRYAGGWFYEAPGSRAQEDAIVRITSYGVPPVQVKNGPALVIPFGGRLLKYDQSKDFQPLGRFCTKPNGTFLNDVKLGDLSHTGNASSGNCAAMIVINDSVAPDIR